MTGDEAFLLAIAEDPSCEENRLIYADWLEDHENPQAADYLRTELALAALPLESPDAPPLRNRLWQTWAGVNPAWLMIFTQPRMLLANPTPFPSAWRNFGLGGLRERQGTYGTWQYDSIPPLLLSELRGEFQYLTTEASGKTERDIDAREREHQQDLSRLVANAKDKNLHLPNAFLKFMGNRSWHTTYRSVTDCYFAFPDEMTPIRANPLDGSVHVHFYCDSQGCLLWDLYVHPSGAHCVIARYLDLFEPEPPDPETGEPHSTGPAAWFVAPSFEAFIYRIFLENQVWYLEHAEYLREQGESPPEMTPAIRAYISHYSALT